MNRTISKCRIGILWMLHVFVACQMNENESIMNDELYIYPRCQTYDYRYQERTVNVVCNGRWTAEIIGDATTVTPQTWDQNLVVKVTVAENTSYREREQQVVFHHNNQRITDTLFISQEAKPFLSLSESNIYVTDLGDQITLRLTGNIAWQCQTTSIADVTILPDHGNGNCDLQVIIGSSVTSRTIEIPFTDLSGTILTTLVIKQTGLELLYQGVSYKLVRMKDGNLWMAENLRYQPSDKLASDNPNDEHSGVWYARGSKDKYDIENLGYLYCWDVVCNGEEPHEQMRGICPEGWHLPSEEECLSVLNDYKDHQIGKTPLSNLENAGFMPQFAGARIKNNPSRFIITQSGYFWTFTDKSTSVNKQNRIFLFNGVGQPAAMMAIGKHKNGYNVRCIKNR